MKRKACLLILTLFLALAACQAPTPTPTATSARTATPIPSDATLALVGGALIDGTGADRVPDSVVVIRGDRIVAAGLRALTTIPDGAQVVDVAGATVLPGIINAHIHSGFSASNLQAWAHEGVTTVRDLGGPYDFARRDALNADNRNARLVAAGPMVTVPDGYPMVPWGATSGLTVTSVDDTRAKVSKLLDDGADVVKLAMESGLDFGRTIPMLSPEEAKAAVETAHARGVWVSAHVLVARDLERALDAGVDDIAHMVDDYLTEALAQRVADSGTIWVPTLELWHGVSAEAGAESIKWLARYVKAGGAVALGTDFDGYTSPFQLGMPMHEMEWMLEAGMTPLQVIVSATQNGARVCGMADELGTLEAGKIADVLVVDGDPLADIHALSAVRMVIHNGEVIRD